MAKGCMAKVMAQGNCFSKIFIETQGPGNCPADLRYFKGMSKPGTVVIAFRARNTWFYALSA